MVMLSPLDRKLWRNLRAMAGQGVAIALVIAGGVSLLLLMAGMTSSLSETRRAYYERYAFADLWVPVVRAPESLVRDVRALDGILSAESRVNAFAILDIPEMAEPASAQIISLPDHGQASVNRIHLSAGRFPSAAHRSEVVVLQSFADAHGMQLGDEIAGTLNGRRIQLDIVGFAFLAWCLT